MNISAYTLNSAYVLASHPRRSRPNLRQGGSRELVDVFQPAKDITHFMNKVLMFSQPETINQGRTILKIAVWPFKQNKHVKIDLSSEKIIESKEVLKTLIEKLCKVLYFVHHICSRLDIIGLFGLHSDTSTDLVTEAFTEEELREILQAQTDMLHDQTFQAIRDIITKLCLFTSPCASRLRGRELLWNTNGAFPRAVFATDGLQQFKEKFKEVMLNDTVAIERFLSPLEEGFHTTSIIPQKTEAQDACEWAAGNFVLAFTLGLQHEYDDKLGSQGRNKKWEEMVSGDGLFRVQRPRLTSVPLNEDFREAGRPENSLAPATSSPLFAPSALIWIDPQPENPHYGPLWGWM